MSQAMICHDADGRHILSLVDGTTCDYETVCIVSFVEEDREMKILEHKDFCDPEKRSAFYAGAAKGVAAP
jgi:hypothetical protein